MKASDIPDKTICAAISYCGVNFGHGIVWAPSWEVARVLPLYPEKVVHAKLRKAVLKGLAEGCECGSIRCRGDFYLTAKGRALLEGA